mmetsp:Transcript_1620/g.2472  ORF Transcript_1620/g.2472 Transcript_1620/m.2472 type:complete len:155 (-) Transcript_1620:584-1048(-)
MPAAMTKPENFSKEYREICKNKIWSDPEELHVDLCIGRKQLEASRDQLTDTCKITLSLYEIVKKAGATAWFKKLLHHKYNVIDANPKSQTVSIEKLSIKHFAAIDAHEMCSPFAGAVVSIPFPNNIKTSPYKQGLMGNVASLSTMGTMGGQLLR